MPTTQVPVGDLHCQHDTYCKEYITQCISCSEKPDKKGFYQVKLHDTILFPEGGGQPNDTGYINDTIKVYNVQRQQLEHVHYTKEPVAAGTQVKLTLDWDRRFDHIQQHTGQHLLSAVLDQAPYELETVGWSMKEKTSFVELGTADKAVPTQDQWDAVERHINHLILKAVPVICHTTSIEDDARPDSLPADYVGTQGVLRTIEIQGLDKNPCCGTHLDHLGHLQAVKLLHTETIRGGNTRIYFVFGQRLISNLGDLYNLSRDLTKSLSVPPHEFLESVGRLQLQGRTLNKAVKKWQEKVAGYAVKDLDRQLEDNAVGLVYDDEEGGMAYLNVLYGLIKDQNVLKQDKAIILASGDRQQGGVLMILTAEDAALKSLAGKVTGLLKGAKGGGSRGRWSGKAACFEGIEKLADLTLE